MKPVLAALALLSATVVSPLIGQGDNENSRKTLAGWRGVYVVVEQTSDEAQRDGLGQDKIRTDVELKLRQAGVTVLSHEESLSTPNTPFLHVAVGTIKSSETGLYAFSVRVEVLQMAGMTRNPSVVSWAATWWAQSRFGMVGSAGLSSYVRDEVRDQTDQFINAYLAANPKR